MNLSLFKRRNRHPEGGADLPANAEDVAVLRIVVREGFSRDLADMLLEDLRHAVGHFEANPPARPTEPAPQFAH